MANIGNNTNGKISHVVKAFFDTSEKEYFKALISFPKEQLLHEELLKKDVKELYRTAMYYINGVEQGKYTEAEMPKVERIIAHCLGAIEDLHKEKVKEVSL